MLTMCVAAVASLWAGWLNTPAICDGVSPAISLASPALMKPTSPLTKVWLASSGKLYGVGVPPTSDWTMSIAERVTVAIECLLWRAYAFEPRAWWQPHSVDMLRQSIRARDAVRQVARRQSA